MASKIIDFAKRNPVVTGVGTIVIGYTTYKVINRLINPKEKIPERPPIPPIPPAERKYSYPAEQYPEFADALQQAFTGSGTDEKRISSIMGKMKTKGDVVALISAYGRRVITGAWGFDTDAMTLAQTITDEMDTKDIEKYVNIPLSRTGFKF
jgi:hypothetical protein